MGRLRVAQAMATLGLLAVLAGLYRIIGLDWTLVAGGGVLILLGVAVVAVNRQ